MANALAWLNDVMQWLGRFVPRLVLVHPTHRGVLFGPRGGAHQVGPGLIAYWPITHDLIIVPVTTQSIQLCGQILPVEDAAGILPRVVICTLNVQFSIGDPVAAATAILHFQALVTNRAQALAARHWPGSLLEANDDWLTKIRQELTDELAAYGIVLKSIDAAGLGVGVVLKNVSDWCYQDSTDGRRPS